MAETGRERPVIVTVLGVLFTTVTALVLVAAAAVLLDYAFPGSILTGLEPPRSRVLASLLVLFLLPSTFPVLWLPLVGAAVLMLIAAIRFLQRQDWARRALEAFSWLGLLWWTVFCVGGIVHDLHLASDITHRRVDFASPFTYTIGTAVVDGIVTAAYATVVGVIIWALRSRTVRDAMLPSGATPLSTPSEDSHA